MESFIGSVEKNDSKEDEGLENEKQNTDGNEQNESLEQRESELRTEIAREVEDLNGND